MCCEQKFRDMLKERGLRLTPQRDMVLWAMHQLSGHATVEEIYALVSSKSAAVDASTVYRSLELLTEFGLVSVIDLGDGQHRYELLSIHGEHHHFYCTVCGKLERIEDSELLPALGQFERRFGYGIELDHVIKGVCDVCRAQGIEEIA